MTVVADARRFAEMHALYRMYDERGRLLYVGITGDLGKRLGEHSFKRWFPLVEDIKLEWKETRASALLAESRAIIAERPRYNKAGLTPSEAAAKRDAEEQKRAAFEARRKAVAESKERLAAEKARIAKEERELAEERARLIAEMPPRDLLADVATILGDGVERVRIADLPRALRQLAPEWEPYQTLNGKQLREFLAERGVRTTKTNNVPQLAPADLRRVIESGPSLAN
jgi:predicted GIY-YIG superfamily endonuclease